MDDRFVNKTVVTFHGLPMKPTKLIVIIKAKRNIALRLVVQFRSDLL